MAVWRSGFDGKTLGNQGGTIDRQVSLGSISAMCMGSVRHAIYGRSPTDLVASHLLDLHGNVVIPVVHHHRQFRKSECTYGMKNLREVGLPNTRRLS